VGSRPPGRWSDAACRLARRNLTRAEARRRLDTAIDSGDVDQVGRRVARKVMLAAASLTSVITSSWAPRG
jgi:hypothetical protein